MLKSWSKLLTLEFSELKNIANDHNLSQNARRKPDKAEVYASLNAQKGGGTTGYTYGYAYAYADLEAKNADALLKRVDHMCYYSSSMLGFCRAGLLEPCNITRLPQQTLMALFEYQPSSQVVGFMLQRTVAAVHSSHMGYILQLAAHTLRPRVTEKFLPQLFHLSWSLQFSVALRQELASMEARPTGNSRGQKVKRGQILTMCDTLLSALARRVGQLPVLVTSAEDENMGEVERTTIFSASMLSLGVSRLVGLMVDSHARLLESTIEQLWQVKRQWITYFLLLSFFKCG